MAKKQFRCIKAFTIQVPADNIVAHSLKGGTTKICEVPATTIEVKEGDIRIASTKQYAINFETNTEHWSFEGILQPGQTRLSDITKKDIEAYFPGKKITAKHVSFEDLARGGAYKVTVEGVNDKDILSNEEVLARKEDIANLNILLMCKTWKGCKILGHTMKIV